MLTHEILHSLGFRHEHTRPDRNQFIRIIDQNIIESRKANFDIIEETEWNNQETPYDTNSLLHYNGDTYSVNGEPTIIDKLTGNAFTANNIFPSSMGKHHK